MANSKITIDEMIVKTEEALVGAGLSNSTVWGSYYRAYNRLRRFFAEKACIYYSFDVVDEFITERKRKYAAKEISRGVYYHDIRAARVLVSFADNGTVYTSYLEHGTRYGLNEFYERILTEYLAQAGYEKNTADDVEWSIRRFLFFLQQIDHNTLAAVNDSHVRRFIMYIAKAYSDGTLHNVMCYLRSFCTYTHEHGFLPVDVSGLFMTSVQRENRIYPCISDEEISKLLAAIDTNTPLGKRDFAMLQLGLTLGMRTIDVVNLKLQDINWTRGEIHLVQRKTRHSVFLPLMPEAGQAIADYILNGRPACNTDYIFLTVSAPVRKIHDETGMGWMFNKYLRKAGIEKEAFDGKSFHSLRRRIATKMIIAGTPVTTVSQVLGQVKTESVRQYLSFDSENLRRCACDFRGIAVDGGVFR